MKTKNPDQKADKKPSDWTKTSTANLVRYKPSGIYFARVRIRGKLFRASLSAEVILVAKLRLTDFIKDRRDEMGDDSAVLTGKMTMGNAVELLRGGRDLRKYPLEKSAKTTVCNGRRRSRR
jgi:hypothetical protein